MNKNIKKILSVLFVASISGCNFLMNSETSSSNLSSSNISSSKFDSSSSTTSTSSTSSSSSNSSSSISEKIIDVKNRDLEFELNETQTAYYIKKYKNYEKNIRLPEKYNNLSVIGVLPKAFMSSGGVENIYFPDSYVEINVGAFYDCTTLKNYYVTNTNPVYSSVDGVLYTKDEKSIVAFPVGRTKTVTVKEGTVSIQSGAFYSSQAKKIVLPESLEEIGTEAFAYAKKLTTINIPSKIINLPDGVFDTCLSLSDVSFSDSLEKISSRAFWGCAKLTEIVFPSSLKTIGDSAFESCSELTRLVFNEGLISVGTYSFAYCPNVYEIVFPSTLKTINDYAFIQNTTLTELSFPEGLEELKEGAFYYTTNVKTVKIPSTVKEIGYDCFTSSDSAIRKFEVASNSNYYKSVNNVLYTKDGKTLVCYPADLVYEINDSTYAVLEGTEVIAAHAFYNAEALTSLTLPASVNHFGYSPFYMCRGLRSLNFEGTIQQFNDIEKEVELYAGQQNIYWNETYYGRISEVTCSDGRITID